MENINKGVSISIAELEEKELIKNLYNLYLHDLSEFTETIEDNNGFFIWDSEDMYWENSSLHPILIRYEDKSVGFILLSEPPYVKPGCHYCIQEVFLLKRYRKKGLAKEAINELFKAYKGKYSLLILERNTAALRFWRNLHECNEVQYQEGMTEQGGERCYYQVFEI